MSGAMFGLAPALIVAIALVASDLRKARRSDSALKGSLEGRDGDTHSVGMYLLIAALIVFIVFAFVHPGGYCAAGKTDVFGFCVRH